MAARKRKSRPSYTANMTNELGRTLWLIAAACGGLLGPDVDVAAEIDALRLALERSVPAGNRAELGRLASDAEALEAKP